MGLVVVFLKCESVNQDAWLFTLGTKFNNFCDFNYHQYTIDTRPMPLVRKVAKIQDGVIGIIRVQAHSNQGMC